MKQAHTEDEYLTIYGAVFEMELDDWLDPSLPSNVPRRINDKPLSKKHGPRQNTVVKPGQ